MNKFLRRKALTIFGIAALAVGGYIGVPFLRDAQFAQAQQQVQATREELSKVEDLATVFRKVGQSVEPSVVHIAIKKSIRGMPRLNPFGRGGPFDEDMFRRMFPDRDGDGEPDVPDSEDIPMSGNGSGVVIAAEGTTGYVITNNHVAGGATELILTLSDGRRITNGKVIGTDPKTDLAIIQIESDRLIPAKWGDSDKLAKGDWVLAFGSPFGYVGSMTHGIISALNRNNVGILGPFGQENFIQVDAPINPGNSGGPLVNIQGELVGINTAIASGNGGFMGVGFAIPSNQVKFVYEQLREKGKIVRGYLGVQIDDVAAPRDPGTPRALRESGFEGKSGVVVMGVQKGPSSGVLRLNDVITHINGKEVPNVQTLRSTIAAMAPNTDVTLTVFRDGKTQDVVVKLGEQPEELGTSPSLARHDRGGGVEAGEALGMRLATLDETLADKYGVRDALKDGGAVVTEVEPRSLAQRAQITEGDVITRIGKEPVTTAAAAAAALKKQNLANGVSLHVRNAEGERLVVVAQQ